MWVGDFRFKLRKSHNILFHDVNVIRLEPLIMLKPSCLYIWLGLCLKAYLIIICCILLMFMITLFECNKLILSLEYINFKKKIELIETHTLNS